MVKAVQRITDPQAMSFVFFPSKIRSRIKVDDETFCVVGCDCKLTLSFLRILPNITHR